MGVLYLSRGLMAYFSMSQVRNMGKKRRHGYSEHRQRKGPGQLRPSQRLFVCQNKTENIGIRKVAYPVISVS